jgi:hypothetical protein
MTARVRPAESAGPIHRFPNFGVHMKPLGMMLALLLLSIPAAAQGIGSVTLLEGSLRLIRGTGVLRGAEGMLLRQGDILESSDRGIVQLEFAGGTVVALGPSSRLYILRHSTGRAGGGAGSQSVGAQLILLSGWLKGESKSAAGSYRYQTPLLAATTANGTVVIHSYESGSDAFVESGSANLAEVSHEGIERHPEAGKAGQFFSGRAGKTLSSSFRPNSAFVDAMPPAFRDTLPSRLARFAGKSVEPKTDHQVTYAEVQPWLTMPSAWRRDFVDRFEPRLRDPEFRKQIELHLAEFPEWDLILHPEKQHPATPPAPVPNSEFLQPRE